jgi:hypothetical protein
MANQVIVDEINSERTAAVTGGRALKTESRYFSYLVTSATGTAAIFAGAGVLHSICMGASAAGAILAVFDGTTAAAIGSDLAIAEIQLGTQQPSRIYDVVFNSGLTYRLSAISCPGVVITYSKGA